MHVNFGIDVINQIKVENPHLWDDAMQREARQMILEGTQLEIEYARDTMPRGVLGMNANMMAEYLQFIANRRLAQIGLTEQFPGSRTRSPGCRRSWTSRRKRTSSRPGSPNTRPAAHYPGSEARHGHARRETTALTGRRA